MTKPERQYFKQNQLAEILGISANTIIRLRREGLPHFEVSKSLILFKLSEVEQWLRDRKQEPRDAAG